MRWLLSSFLQIRVPNGHPLTLRVDRGSQCIARRFQGAAKALGVTLEYTGIQCPDDKLYIESFFGHDKTEEVYRTSYTMLAEALGRLAALSHLVCNRARP